MRLLEPPRRAFAAALLALASAPAVFDGDSTTQDGGFSATVVPVLEQRCAGCHGRDSLEGGLDLAAIRTESDARAVPGVWEAVRDRVIWDEMPPPGAAQPAADERAALLAWIDALLGPLEDASSSADAAVEPEPPLLRRLNNREYENTIRDLFGVEFDAEAFFPRDAGGRGFDTNAESSTLSDALLEKLLDAAEDVAARAIVVDDTREPWARRFQGDELEARASTGSDAALYSNGAAVARVTVPRDGRYALRATAWAQQAGDELARMALRVDGKRLDTFEVAAGRDAPESFALEADLKGGARKLQAAFVNDFYRPESDDEARRDRNLYVRWIEIEGPLDPPTPSAFQGELFARFGPELGKDRVERVLAHLAELCWRRAPDDAEVGRLVRATEPFESAAGAASFEERVRLGLTMILSSPRFLFRVEPEPVEGADAAPVDGRSLAVRLSYFLWSSTPDAELLARADDGTLVRDDVRAAQVDRMLADPRARALADGFAAQWLEIEPLMTIEFDATRFPEATEELRASMRAETLALFRACLAEDLDVRELLRADFTFVDERLAAHYGLDFARGEPADEYGAGLRRVSLADTPRRGVLSHASVLAATSNPTRTSPVKRGKWVLQALLGQPPPPPPPGADQFDESPTAVASAPLRERLAQHRDDAKCAVCHEKMDALGFGLERFGPTGAWRDEADGFPIDASAELPGGVRFDGARELADVLARDDAFPETLLSKLWTYALGRGVERGDRASLRAILDGLDPEHPTLAAMIRGIALSPAF